jgi:predicted RNA-binding protein Jag
MYFSSGTTNGSSEAEFEADTTEEAINKAEKALGLDRNKMKIKVVCEEKKGLFGMRGAKMAKIKVLFKKPHQ